MIPNQGAGILFERALYTLFYFLTDDIMISVKLQIDCIIKSNKIVIFLNELRQSSNVHDVTAEKIYEKFKSDSSSYGYTQKSTLESTGRDPYNILKLPELDIIKLLEMYGITKKLVTIVDINSLKNTKLCEKYIKTAYCNDLNIKVIIFSIS